MRSAEGSNVEKAQTGKINAAKEAAKLVEDGMVIGIGTGTTVEYFIKELGERIQRDGIEVWGVPSSYHSHMLAVENGIVVADLFQFEELDLCVDGADQVDVNLNCIKGKGGALLREKIIAQASERVVIIVDSGKVSDKLRDLVPVEVFPFAYGNVVRRLQSLGGKCKLREARSKIGPCISDNGNLIFDVDFGVILNPVELEMKINSIAGVVENGIFPGEIIDRVIVGHSDGTGIMKK
jgi:ribose 5-phosphate isomerase A